MCVGSGILILATYMSFALMVECHPLNTPKQLFSTCSEQRDEVEPEFGEAVPHDLQQRFPLHEHDELRLRVILRKNVPTPELYCRFANKTGRLVMRIPMNMKAISSRVLEFVML